MFLTFFRYFFSLSLVHNWTILVIILVLIILVCNRLRTYRKSSGSLRFSRKPMSLLRIWRFVLAPLPLLTISFLPLPLFRLISFWNGINRGRASVNISTNLGAKPRTQILRRRQRSSSSHGADFRLAPTWMWTRVPQHQMPLSPVPSTLTRLSAHKVSVATVVSPTVMHQTL